MLQGWTQQYMSRTHFSWSSRFVTVDMAYFGGDLDKRRPNRNRGYNPRSAVLDLPKLLADIPSGGSFLPLSESSRGQLLGGGRAVDGLPVTYEVLAQRGKLGSYAYYGSSSLSRARFHPRANRQARYLDHATPGASAACHAGALLPSCDRTSPNGPLHPPRSCLDNFITGKATHSLFFALEYSTCNSLGHTCLSLCCTHRPSRPSQH